MSLGAIQEVDIGELGGLNARSLAILAGPGGGKTEALVALHGAADVRAVLSFDPVGQLARRVEELELADVLDVDTKTLPSEVLRWVAGTLRGGRSVCLNLRPAGFGAPPEVVDAVLPAIEHVPDVLVIAEEAQRIVPQSMNPAYSYVFQEEVEIGRNHRHGRVVASQRAASVHKEVIARCDTLLLGRMQDATDVDAVRARLRLNIPNPVELEATLRAMLDLDAGCFLMREPANPPRVNG